MKYDDTNLRKLYADLDPKGRKKVIKSACRKVGNEIRKVAINNLRCSGLRHADEMTGGVRVVVFRREAGVRVTVASRRANKKTGKGERGMHLNRRGLKKPVLAWAEAGTKRRKTKEATRYFIPGGGWRAGQDRGAMRRYGFIAKTKTQIEHTAGPRIKEEVANQVTIIAKKYGCT